MKYMILIYGSQQLYDAMAGQAVDGPALSPEDFAPVGAFLESFKRDLEESGEFVDRARWPLRSMPGGCSSEALSPS